MLREGYSLYGYKDRGYWCDIGKIPTLYRCNLDVLQGKAKTYLEPVGKTYSEKNGDGIYFVSNSAVVEDGAEIRRDTIISPHVHLAEGSRTGGAIVMEKTEIKKGAVIKDAILCEECQIGEEAQVSPSAVLGAKSVVEPHAVSLGKKYSPNIILSRKAPFCEEGLVFTERGAACGDSLGLDHFAARKLGYSLARLCGEKVGVLWDEAAQGSAAFATSFAGGVILGGANALMLSRGTEEMASFGANLFSIPVVFVSVAQNKGVFFAFGKDVAEVAKTMLYADECKSGKMTVVVHNAFGYIYWLIL